MADTEGVTTGFPSLLLEMKIAIISKTCIMKSTFLAITCATNCAADRVSSIEKKARFPVSYDK